MMKKKIGCPGILMYYDRIVNIVKVLDDDKAGKLFKAMYYYAAENIIPEFDDTALSLYWPQLEYMIDENKENYLDKCANNSYNAKYGKNSGAVAPPDREEYVKEFKKNSPIETKSKALQKEDEERKRQDEFEKMREIRIKQAEGYGK